MHRLQSESHRRSVLLYGLHAQTSIGKPQTFRFVIRFACTDFNRKATDVPFCCTICMHIIQSESHRRSVLLYGLHAQTSIGKPQMIRFAIQFACTDFNRKATDVPFCCAICRHIIQSESHRRSVLLYGLHAQTSIGKPQTIRFAIQFACTDFNRKATDVPFCYTICMHSAIRFACTDFNRKLTCNLFGAHSRWHGLK
jgi:hypothetical protein